MDVGRCTVSPSPPTDSLRPLPPPPPAAAAAASSSRQRRPWPPPLPPPCRRRPLKLTDRAGPNGLESHAVASPWRHLGIHTSGPLYCRADISSKKHSHEYDPQSIKIPASKEKATCPIRDTPCHPRRSVPRCQPYRPVPRPSIALCDTAAQPVAAVTSQ